MAKLDWQKVNNSSGKSTRWNKIDYVTKTSSSTRISNNTKKLRIVNQWVREVMLIDPTITYQECLAAAMQSYKQRPPQ